MAAIDNEIYDHLHDEWWSDDEFMAILRHSVNPPRFDYFHEILTKRLNLNLNQLTVLDVGCGGGLLSEKFAALGCQVTGVDRSLPTLAAARKHAENVGLSICYFEASAEVLPFEAQQFDVVCCCDVLEHVDNVDQVVEEISRVLKPGGIFFFDTINRTLRSKLIAIKMAQDWALTRFLPRNVHVWEKFIRPAELSAMLGKHGLSHWEFTGLSPVINPFKSLTALIQLKFNKINFAEFGTKFSLARSKDLSI